MNSFNWLTQASCTKGPIAKVELTADEMRTVDEWCAMFGIRTPLPVPTEDEKRALEASVEAMAKSTSDFPKKTDPEGKAFKLSNGKIGLLNHYKCQGNWCGLDVDGFHHHTQCGEDGVWSGDGVAGKFTIIGATK